MEGDELVLSVFFDLLRLDKWRGRAPTLKYLFATRGRFRLRHHETPRRHITTADTSRGVLSTSSRVVRVI
ncbi:MAG: hypothetical protein B5766_05705 [Candidatus Lumbricidophila eiseniae]|uniref:Uncharacterized protein n=1 Tax=Candidatus Lumbricidiphila eiseniae TaxID=1969409 RepID=A0A2A6FSH6_9MICO|nr:MAG: hypothetical protein B5766_05705 [Candidatus Lumbricidophila eiseniae]